MKQLLLAILLMQFPAPVQNQTGVVTGVLRSSAGMPLAGVRVAAILIPNPPQSPNPNASVAPVISDVAGRYQLVNLPAGRYYIAAGPAEAPSYYPGVIPMAAATAVTVTGGGNATGIDFSPPLPANPGVRVSGEISNPIDARLFSGPRLTMSASSSTATLAPDGSFAFENVLPGAHTITLSVNALTIDVQKITVANANISGVKLAVPRAVQVTGRITVSEGGPIPRLSVSLAGSNGSFNPPFNLRADGNFNMTIPEGEQFIGISNLPAGYLVKSLTYGQTNLLLGPAVIPALNPEPITIVLATTQKPPWVRVGGRVIGSAVAVRLSGDKLLSEVQTNVNADGTFEFPKVLPGVYALGVSPNYENAPTMQMAVQNRDVSDIEFVVPVNVSIRGRIVMEDGQPIPRPNLIFNGQRGRMNPNLRQNNDGTFQIQVPEDEFRVEVAGVLAIYQLKSMRYGDIDLFRSTMKVDAAQVRELQLTFGLAQPSAVFRVSGQIRNFDNQPVPGRKIMLGRYGTADAIQSTVGPTGAFSFDKVTPGTYITRFEPAVTGTTQATVVVVDKDIANVDLSFPLLVAVHGQILVDGGVPFSAFPISFTGPPGTFGMDPPGADQLHNFSATIPVGDYKITFTAFVASCCGVEAMPAGYSVKSIVYDGKPLPEDRSIQVRTSNAGKLIITVTAGSVKVSGHVSGFGNLPPQTKVMIGGSDRYDRVPGYSSDIRADGSFEFLKVVPGTYTVRFLPDVTGVETRTISVGNTDVSGIELVMPRRTDVKGKVVLDGDIPLPRIGMQANSIGIPLRIESDRTFIVVLPEGDSTIRISDLPAGFQLTSFSYGPTDLLKDPLRIDVSKLQEMTIHIGAVGRWPKVSGRLIGAERLQPDWRHIRLAGPNLLDVEPSADGSFEFPHVPPGQYKVSVNAPPNMAITTSMTIAVADRDIQGIELHAVAVVGITGYVVVEGGGPVPEFNLKAAGNSVPEILNASVQTNGNFSGDIPQAEFRLTLDQLTPGYSVKSMLGGGVDLLKNPWKVSPASTDLVITFAVTSPPPWKRVSGRIVGDIPKIPPAAPATVAGGTAGGGRTSTLGGPYGASGPERVLLQKMDGSNFRNRSFIDAAINADGTFSFDKLLPGTYIISLFPVAASIQPRSVIVRDRDLTGVDLTIVPNSPALR